MARLAHSVSLALCKQENTPDIALDTFQSLISISEVRSVLHKPSKSFRFQETHKHMCMAILLNWWSLLIGGAALRWFCLDFF